MICDPACGTGGFLVSAGEYLKENHKEEIFYDRAKKGHYMNHMFHGYDMDRTMSHIGAMNMMTHGIENPYIEYRDSLSDQNTDREKYSLILANPPFKGSLDADIVSTDLLKVCKTKKTELLFLALFLRMLKVGGRCACIVPDGVLFGSSKAHKDIRKEIVKGNRLEAVISMPSGVFKPYAGVSTAVLVFTKTGHGGTDQVWFYDMRADGFFLDDKRTEVTENDIPDIVKRFHDRERTEQSFLVPKEEITGSQRLDMNRSGTHTVKSWVQMWYAVYAEPRLRENTKDYYLNYINNHIIPELGDIKLDKLTTIQIQKFYNDLQKNGRVQRYQHIQLKNKGLSVRVAHGIHTLLNNCLEQAVAERLILVNPARGCKLPKMEKREMKVLPEEKIRPYLMEADKRGLLAPFYLELTTGLRRGELLALLWTDLDVENRTISITKQVTRAKGELVVSQPKTHNSIRVLPVSQQAVDLLVEEHKKHPGNPYMFPSPKTGGMFDPDSFRHTFATLSLKNGVDVKTLSSTLGHYSAGFTLSTYTHATPDMMREAADTMGDVIGKAM